MVGLVELTTDGWVGGLGCVCGKGCVGGYRGRLGWAKMVRLGWVALVCVGSGSVRWVGWRG